MWEITMQMQMKGMNMSLPPRTVRRCVTSGELSRPNGDVPVPQGPGNGSMDCKVDDMQRSGNNVHWTMHCTGQGDLQASGRMSYDSPQHYTGQIEMTGNMQGQNIQMTQQMEGRRVGACGS